MKETELKTLSPNFLNFDLDNKKHPYKLEFVRMFFGVEELEKLGGNLGF